MALEDDVIRALKSIFVVDAAYNLLEGKDPDEIDDEIKDDIDTLVALFADDENEPERAAMEGKS